MFRVHINGSLVSLGIGTALAMLPTRACCRCLTIGRMVGGDSQNSMTNVWDNMAETALSYREREALAGNPRQLLRAAAQKLRLIESDEDTGAGGELAEALLYGILKDQYQAIPVVPKIFYKQNTNDYAKGSDSVHIVLTPPMILASGLEKLNSSIA